MNNDRNSKSKSLVFTKVYPPKIEWYHSQKVYDDLKEIFYSAHKKLIKNDFNLFVQETSERSICGALMLRLNSALWGTPFSGYHVDVEYNRNRDGWIKTIIDRYDVITNITCDLIIHSRGTCIEQDNLIALEMKKADRTKKEKTNDKNRLIALTKEENSVWCFDNKTFPEHVCRYILGIYYEIGSRYDEVYLEFYRQGEKVDTQIISLKKE